MKAGSTSNKSDLFSNEKQSRNLHILFFLFITTSYKLRELSSKSPCHCSSQRQTPQKQNSSRDLFLLWQKMRRKLHIKNVRTKSPLICLVNQKRIRLRVSCGPWITADPLGSHVHQLAALLAAQACYWEKILGHYTQSVKWRERNIKQWEKALTDCNTTVSSASQQGAQGNVLGVTTVTVWTSRMNILNSI